MRSTEETTAVIESSKTYSRSLFTPAFLELARVGTATHRRSASEIAARLEVLPSASALHGYERGAIPNALAALRVMELEEIRRAEK